MDINYKFVPMYESEEKKAKSDILSYAGKLLELVDCATVVVTLDADNKPVIFQTPDKLLNALDFNLDTY